LLAGGANVNENTTRGETALMRAVFFGHSDVVRLLLNAGADARMKDSSGLTAAEWAVRRGFADLSRLLRNPPPAAVAPPPLPPANAVEDQARREAWEERRRKDAEAAERNAHAEALKRAEDEARRRAEQERREAEDAQRRAVELARIKARAELQRRAEEHRRQIEEEEARLKSEEAAPPLSTQVMPAAPAAPHTLTLEPAPPEEEAPIKHCPKCHRVYKSDILAYCVHDSVRLISGDAPATTEAPTPIIPETASANDGRRWMWFLVALSFLGGGMIGYLIISNIFPVTIPEDPVPAQTQPAPAPPIPPSTDGVLKGKETILPAAERTPEAKTEGVTGQVTVEVIVNKKGEVISARALGGHPLLQASAVRAAREAKFAPEKLPRRSAKVSGTITYSFQ
jgi:TonB family protein